MDIFYQKFSGRRQGVGRDLGNLLFLLPVALFLGWASWDYVSNAWSTFEASSESGGLKFVYLQKKHHPGTGRQPGTARYFQSDQGNLRLQRSPASSGGETWLS